jgi:hypothetical protein
MWRITAYQATPPDRPRRANLRRGFARDTKLERDVALKVSSSAFASQAERFARCGP